MSTTEQFFGGGSFIGSQRLFSEAGTIITDPDTSVWLRSGSTASAATYPRAAAIDYLKCHGLLATQVATLTLGMVDIATNGAGKWVATYGGTSNLVSVDNGVTWVLVVHNAGYATTTVTYSATLDLFICAGNDSSVFFTSTQAAANVATAWTVRAGAAISTGFPNTAKVRAGANEVVMICCANGSGVGQAAYSINGTAWTPKNFSGALASGSSVLLQNMGGSNWFACDVGGGGQKSTDGQTWSSQALPASVLSITYGAAKLVGVSGGVIYTSTTGLTGSWSNLGMPFDTNRIRKLMYDGTRFIATLVTPTVGTFQPSIAYSTDLLSWFTRGISNKPWSDAIETAFLSDGNNLVFLPNGSSSGGLYGQFSTVDAVGVPYPITTSANTAKAQQTTYTRVA